MSDEAVWRYVIFPLAVGLGAFIATLLSDRGKR